MHKINKQRQTIFTIDSDDRIQKFIQGQLECLANEIIRCLSFLPEAIFLVGGFGRGEGGVVQENAGYRAINDYDLVIIIPLEQRGQLRQLNQFLQKKAKGFAKMVNIKAVDILVWTWREVEKNKNTLFVYEFVHGHHKIAGKFSGEFPVRYKPGWEIPEVEGLRLMLNRGGSLMIAAKELWFQDVWDKAQQEMLQIECHKAILGMGDAWLIHQKKYAVQYSERIRIATQLLDEVGQDSIKIVLEAYRNSLKLKIQPHFPQRLKEDVKTWWLTIQQWHESVLKRIESDRLEKIIESWTSYRNMMRFRNPFGWRHSIRQLVRKVMTKRRTEKELISCLPFILYGFRKKNLENDYYNNARKILGMKERNITLDWKFIMEYYIQQWHP